MFDLVFFYKICFDRRRRLEVKQWCYIGSAEWADDMVDTTFFFLCLGHGRDLFYCYPFFHISGRIMHGKHRMGKILLVGWCNVTAICWDICFLFMLSTLARSCGGCLGRHHYEIRSFATSLLRYPFEFRCIPDCRVTWG